MKSIFLQFLIVLIFFWNISTAQPQIELQPFASGLNAPLGIVNTGDERLFVVEQRGRIKIIDEQGTVNAIPFLDISSKVSQSGGERGLLGLAFHPDYHENGYFYVNYTRASNGTTVIARFSVDENNPDIADPESEIQLFTVDQPYSNHNGGQLQFGPDGYLYIGLGDGGSGGDPNNNAQNPSTFLGKILRINVDNTGDSPYSIPPDNPFVNNEKVRDEIWAMGVRNPWRFSFDRYTNDLWIADVGQNAYEEINFQTAGSSGGENYGWRCYEGNHNYNQTNCTGEENYTFPVFEYSHEGSSCSGSVTGGFVYRGALYNKLFGEYIFADYCTGTLYHITPNSEGFTGGELGDFSPSEYTSFGEDMYGELYIVMQNSGEIGKVVETSSCSPVAMIRTDSASAKIEMGDSITISAFYNPALEYHWNKNGKLMPGEADHKLKIKLPGIYTLTVTNPQNGCSSTSDTFEVSVVSTPAIANAFPGANIFPNPVSDVLHINGLQSDNTVSIRLINLAGIEVISKLSNQLNSVNLNIETVPPGLYLLRISCDGKQLLRKIVVNH